MSRTGPGAARSAAHRALVEVARAHGARLSDHLDTAGLEPRDRALAREISFGVERRRRLLDFVLGSLAARGLPADPRALAALRIGAYQLLYLTRIPSHAAVDESVSLAGRRTAGFVNAVLRRLCRAIAARPADPSRSRGELELEGDRTLQLEVELPADATARLALLQGLPGFLVRRWVDRFGETRAARIAAASSRTPVVCLRASARAGSAQELSRRLGEEGVECRTIEHPDMLAWTGGASPFETAAFGEGLFVAQDPTSVAAAQALGARAGEQVLDLCAAPGTKSTLLAEQVGPDGRVYAWDADHARLALVAENAERLRLPQLVLVDDPGALPPMDRVLVDAPCSNTGVLARRVEVRHRIRASDIASCARAQVEMLRRAVGAVREGGRIVYSTCSIEAEENEQVVSELVSEGTVRLVDQVTTLPDSPRHDGGYHAVLEAGRRAADPE